MDRPIGPRLPTVSAPLPSCTDPIIVDVEAVSAAMTTPVTLEGELVRLSPLRREDHDELAEALLDGRIWEHVWYATVPSPEGLASEIERRLAEQAAGRMTPFTVRRRSDDQVLGMTSIYNFAPQDLRLEIGFTWNRASAQGSGSNADSKRLLLGHAFETIGCLGVEIRTHFLNMTSRAAIERLGAHLDGVLRQHRVLPNGTSRDTCVYSILRYEWPAVREGLRHRVAKHLSGSPAH